MPRKRAVDESQCRANIDTGRERLPAKDATPLGALTKAQYRPASGTAPAEEQRINALERETYELGQANEILRLAGAFFA